jgi:hypothetical protein
MTPLQAPRFGVVRWIDRFKELAHGYIQHCTSYLLMVQLIINNKVGRKMAAKEPDF